MHISPITFGLFFGFLFLCTPEAYGLSSRYGLAANAPSVDEWSDEALAKHVYAYNLRHDDPRYAIWKDSIVRSKILREIYVTAMHLYGKKARRDRVKSQLALYDLKGKMGKQQQWSALLVGGYVREVNKDKNLKIYVPKELCSLIKNFVMFGRYQETEKQVLMWVVNDWMNVDVFNFVRDRWMFITEWLAEGIGNPTFCREINALKKRDTGIYNDTYFYPKMDTLLTYEDNFLDKRLLQWLIHEKQWPLPTDAYTTACSLYAVNSEQSIRLYKIRSILFLKEGREFLYYLQCVHTLNKSIMATFCSEEETEKIRMVRNKVIEKRPYILRPLSQLSIVYWSRTSLYRGTIAGCNVVYDLLYIAIEITFVPSMIFFFPIFILYILLTEVTYVRTAYENNKRKPSMG